jgi:hypothetical protein
MMTMRSEEIRLRYFYRRLIVDGKAKISFEAARRLVGPDCAYHLYAGLGHRKPRGDPGKSRARRK